MLQLVGNKSDLPGNGSSEREVTEEEAQTMAGEYNITCIETSAKSGDGVEDAFTRVITQIYDQMFANKGGLSS